MDILQLMSMAGAALFMVFFFGFCIFVHELGHFLAARACGLKVLSFSLGFKKVWCRTWRGVEYRIGCIPFGGYVEIPQIDSTETPKDLQGNELPKAKPWQKIIAVVAGPSFNFLFGFVLATVIWICGMPMDTSVLREVEVASIEEQSPEYRAGLRKGDFITKINGKSVNSTWGGVVRDILCTIGDVTLQVRRGNRNLDVVYRPAVNKAVHPEEEIAYPFFQPKLPIKLYPDQGSPAAKAGVKHGDELLSVNGRNVSSLDEFEILVSFANGAPIHLKLLRDGKEIEIKNIQPDKTSFEDEKGRKVAGLYRVGLTFTPNEPALRVLTLPAGMPGVQSGLKPGDVIEKVDGKKLSNSSEFPELVDASQGKPMKLSVRRAGRELTIDLTPIFIHFNTIGVKYAYLSHPTPMKQFYDVLDITYKSMRGLVVSFGNKLGLTEKHTTIKPRHLSGPVNIGRILYLSVYKGSLVQGLYMVMLITFNLGILNLMPIPVLDGGHVVLALLESVFRRPVSPKILQPVTMAFITILIGFMLFVTFYDFKRLIFSFSPEPKTEQVQPTDGDGRNAPAK